MTGTPIEPGDRTDHIDEWVRREYEKKNYQPTKAHRVESRIGERFVTNCGKQLRIQTLAKAKNHLEFYANRRAVIDAGITPCEPCS